MQSSTSVLSCSSVSWFRSPNTTRGMKEASFVSVNLRRYTSVAAMQMAHLPWVCEEQQGSGGGGTMVVASRYRVLLFTVSHNELVQRSPRAAKRSVTKNAFFETSSSMADALNEMSVLVCIAAARATRIQLTVSSRPQQSCCVLETSSMTESSKTSSTFANWTMSSSCWSGKKDSDARNNPVCCFHIVPSQLMLRHNLRLRTPMMVQRSMSGTPDKEPA